MNWLNNELTNRFVDKRISLLGKSLKENKKLLVEVKSDSSIYIDNLKVGELDGFVLKLLDASDPSSNLFFKNLKKELNKEIKDRVKKFYTIDDNNLSIDNEAKIYWDTSPIGWLTQSDDPLKPNIQIINSDLLIQDQIFLQFLGMHFF